MASVTGSRLAFFGNDPTGANVNIVLTPDGTGTLATVAGAYNIEVFTSTIANPSLGAGFQASALVVGAVATGTNNVIQAGSAASQEQVLDGSYTLVDQGGAGGEAISIVGSAGGGTVTVAGFGNDTITGSANTLVNQLIDASVGLQTVIGGAGNTTVFGGTADNISGSGALTVIGGGHNGMVVNAGAGGLAAQQFGTHNSVSGGGGITFIDDGFAGGSANTLVGGSGGSNFVQGNVGDSIVAGSGPVTILNSFTFGHQTVVGGSGLSTIVEGGASDSILAGSGLFAFISATDNTHIQGGTNAIGATDVFSLGDSNTVSGGAGTLIVGAAATNSLIIGGSGDLQVFGIGAGNTVFGSTAGTTSINDVGGGGAQLIGGAGNTTIIGGANDSIVAAGGNTEVRLRSDITAGAEDIRLSSGLDIVRDIAAGTTPNGAHATVTGFNTAFDKIASSQSVVSGGGTGAGALVASASANQVGADTIINFSDGSTMTLVSTTLNNISFIQ